MFLHVLTYEQKSGASAASLWTFLRNAFLGACGTAVPLFFLFSGFLQFAKEEKYPVILKKKARSLLLPYVIWTVACYLFLWGVQAFPQFVRYFRAEDVVRNWQVGDYFNAFFYHRDDESLRQPLLGQFWYIRELVILTLLHPVLSFWHRKSPGTLLLFAVLAYFGAIPLFILVNGRALFFYAVGMAFAARSLSFFKAADSAGLAEYGAAFLFIQILKFALPGRFSFGGIELIICCLMVLRISKALASNKRAYGFLRRCAGFSFFLYAVHWPFIINPLKAVVPKVVANEAAQFFTVGILTVAIGTALGVALKKAFPRLFALLTGGRG